MLQPLIRQCWFICLGLGLALFIGVVNQSVSVLAKPLTEATQFNQQGYTFLQHGQPEAALQSWQKASELYEKTGNTEGVTGSRINQTLAMQALGLNLRACGVLTEVLQLELPCQLQPSFDAGLELLKTQIQQQPESQVQVIGLRRLGSILQALGRLNESEVVLIQAQQMAQSMEDTFELAQVALNLGTVYQLLGSQTQDQFFLINDARSQENNLVKIRDYTSQSFEQYQRAIALAPNHSTSAQAKLNSLKLAVSFESWLKQNSLQKPAYPLLNQLRQQVSSYARSPLVLEFYGRLSPIEAIYGQLGFIDIVLASQAVPGLQEQLFGSSLPQLQILVEAAIAKATEIQSQRALSFGLGTKATLLAQLQVTPKLVETTYEQASAIAQSVRAWDSAYQWQRELGKLYIAQGNITLGVKAYSAAISSLDQVRSNLIGVVPEIQFSFREQIEPIYREYMQALLKDSQPDLSEVLQVNESLQVAELENFLRCGKLDLVRFEQLELEEIAEQPTIIHVIELDQNTVVIVRAVDGSLHYYEVETNRINAIVESLIINLQSPDALQVDRSVFVQYGQLLYRSLLQPAKNDGTIPNEGTLVFVLDTLLQNVPMALLHNGEQFLIENYRISLTLGSLIQKPQQLEADRLKALVAGLSKVSPGFQDDRVLETLQSLPATEIELKSVEKSLSDSVVLLNEAFTVERFQREVLSREFPIIHVATHGQFSSDPTRTLLIAWDKLIDITQLNQLLRAPGQNGEPSIELLVLSACQTAKGDPRSALGIAGITTQSGARSTLASLWNVDDASTAVLMNEFYQGLTKGFPKAEALREAQITLLKSSLFSHPYYWSAFVLVGSWL